MAYAIGAMMNTTFEDLLNNPEKLANMTMEQIEAATAATEPIVDGKPKDGEAVESPATPAVIDKPIFEDEPQGVADKTGENIIPYEVLSSERNKSKELAEGKAAAEARIAELEAKLNSVAAIDANVDESLFLSDDEIEALADELPDQAARTSQMQNLIRQQAAALQQKDLQTQQFQQSLLKDSVQIAIDSVPKLAYIQATKPALFNMAVSVDNQLQNEANSNATIAAMSLKERFELAISRVEAEIGIEIDIKKSSKPSSEQLKQAATQAKAAADSKASAIPISMADIPGGAIPPVDEFAQLANASYAEIENAFAKMTPQQQEAVLAKIKP